VIIMGESPDMIGITGIAANKEPIVEPAIHQEHTVAAAGAGDPGDPNRPGEKTNPTTTSDDQNDIVFIGEPVAVSPSDAENIKFSNEPFVGGDEKRIAAAVQRETDAATKGPLDRLAKAFGLR
jgi:hypothetical protein